MDKTVNHLAEKVTGRQIDKEDVKLTFHGLSAANLLSTLTSLGIKQPPLLVKFRKCRKMGLAFHSDSIRASQY